MGEIPPAEPGDIYCYGDLFLFENSGGGHDAFLTDHVIVAPRFALGAQTGRKLFRPPLTAKKDM